MHLSEFFKFWFLAKFQVSDFRYQDIGVWKGGGGKLSSRKK